MAKGSCIPRFWLHFANDHTIRWRVVPLAQDEFALEAYWVANVPNARLGDQIRRRVFASNRAREYAWRKVDEEAWNAAARDGPLEPFAWPGEACLGGRAEGDGGLPVGLTSRAHGVGWRVLACTRERAFINVIYMVMLYGIEADDMRRAAAVRSQIEAAKEEEVVWVRQANDYNYYGNLNCRACTANGRCLRCLYALRHGVPHDIIFQEPSMMSASRADWDNDIMLYKEMGVLP